MATAITPSSLSRALASTEFTSYLEDNHKLLRLVYPYLRPLYRFGRRGLTRFVVDFLTSLAYRPYFASVLGFSSLRTSFVHIRYREHPRCYALYSSASKYHANHSPTEKKKSTLIMFVHGGAWGSGRAEFYSPLAASYNKQGYSVAVVGYRTYPDASVSGQVDDVHSAYLRLRSGYDSVILVGHSSGSHVTLLAVLKHAMDVTWLGLAGVYDVPAHFEFESKRGLEMVSTMQPANGSTWEAMRGWRWVPMFAGRGVWGSREDVLSAFII